MRPTSKISVSLLAISIVCVGLFVLCDSVWTQEAKKANPRIKELQQQRIAVLEDLRDTAKNFYRNARTSFEDVHEAERELLAARIEYAENQNDRIKACDEAVKEALEWQQFVQGLKQSARATRLTELKADAFLLETQLMREKAAAVE